MDHLPPDEQDNFVVGCLFAPHSDCISVTSLSYGAGERPSFLQLHARERAYRRTGEGDGDRGKPNRIVKLGGDPGASTVGRDHNVFHGATLTLLDPEMLGKDNRARLMMIFGQGPTRALQAENDQGNKPTSSKLLPRLRQLVTLDNKRLPPCTIAPGGLRTFPAGSPTGLGGRSVGKDEIRRNDAMEFSDDEGDKQSLDRTPKETRGATGFVQGNTPNKAQAPMLSNSLPVQHYQLQLEKGAPSMNQSVPYNSAGAVRETQSMTSVISDADEAYNMTLNMPAPSNSVHLKTNSTIAKKPCNYFKSHPSSAHGIVRFFNYTQFPRFANIVAPWEMWDLEMLDPVDETITLRWVVPKEGQVVALCSIVSDGRESARVQH
ncbi:hypothetical protein BU15DRAFT_64828 [Melanogaster broomeanus]|nr:hypothetical protein BU15DRAFT_64828 [Melanogaster broomeanus]